MQNVILVRYGEIHLKGLNRPYFERLLMQAMKNAVRPFGAKVTKGDGRYYVRDFADAETENVIAALRRVFGIHSVSPAKEMEKDVEIVYAAALEELKRIMQDRDLTEATFKIEAKRSDKRFPMKSMEIAADCGGDILDRGPGLSVDVRNPDIKVFVEMRESAYVYSESLPGQGGMPIGSNGRATLLLSGGIDSPVAGYMIAKRGVTLDAVHYESFPYTSERAREKVIELTRLLTQYTGPIMLHIVHFTDIQMAIHEHCPEEQLTLIMRRYMMRIAEMIARKGESGALITGESLGQVASQTMESLNVTNSVVTLPVFRPLIGMDKTEIIERAEQIGTYETSILPYEDCCTVFVPKHPTTRPKLDKIRKGEEALLGMEEELIKGALEKTESILVRNE